MNISKNFLMTLIAVGFGFSTASAITFTNSSPIPLIVIGMYVDSDVNGGYNKADNTEVVVPANGGSVSLPANVGGALVSRVVAYNALIPNASTPADKRRVHLTVNGVITATYIKGDILDSLNALVTADVVTVTSSTVAAYNSTIHTRSNGSFKAGNPEVIYRVNWPATAITSETTRIAAGWAQIAAGTAIQVQLTGLLRKSK